MGAVESAIKRVEETKEVETYYLKTRLSFLFPNPDAVSFLLRLCLVLEQMKFPVDYENWVLALSTFHALFCDSLSFQKSPMDLCVKRKRAFFRYFQEVDPEILERILESTKQGNLVPLSLGSMLLMSGSPQDKLRILFDLCDRNSRGIINEKEFKSFFFHLFSHDRKKHRMVTEVISQFCAFVFGTTLSGPADDSPGFQGRERAGSAGSNQESGVITRSPPFIGSPSSHLDVVSFKEKEHQESDEGGTKPNPGEVIWDFVKHKVPAAQELSRRPRRGSCDVKGKVCLRDIHGPHWAEAEAQRRRSTSPATLSSENQFQDLHSADYLPVYRGLDPAKAFLLDKQRKIKDKITAVANPQQIKSNENESKREEEVRLTITPPPIRESQTFPQSSRSPSPREQVPFGELVSSPRKKERKEKKMRKKNGKEKNGRKGSEIEPGEQNERSGKRKGSRRKASRSHSRTSPKQKSGGMSQEEKGESAQLFTRSDNVIHDPPLFAQRKRLRTQEKMINLLAQKPTLFFSSQESEQELELAPNDVEGREKIEESGEVREENGEVREENGEVREESGEVREEKRGEKVPPFISQFPKESTGNLSQEEIDEITNFSIARKISENDPILWANSPSNPEGKGLGEQRTKRLWTDDAVMDQKQKVSGLSLLSRSGVELSLASSKRFIPMMSPKQKNKKKTQEQSQKSVEEYDPNSLTFDQFEKAVNDFGLSSFGKAIPSELVSKEIEEEEDDDPEFSNFYLSLSDGFGGLTDLAELLHEGLRNYSDPGLLYHGGYLEVQASNRKKWKKRFFMVTPTILYKYITRPEEENWEKSAVSCIQLTNCKLCGLLPEELLFCLVQKSSWVSYRYKAPDHFAYRRWIQALFPHIRIAIPLNPSSSFAPLRINCAAEWFVTAKYYYRSLLADLNEAKNEVYIADWFFSSEIFLLRHENSGSVPPSLHCGAGELCVAGKGKEDGGNILSYCEECIQASQLNLVLANCARRGVQVFVLAWKETKLAIDLGSEYSAQLLRSISPNIHVILHPPEFPVTYSHHQKLVTIDQHVAYIGGIDLCLGRYDEAGAYRLNDQNYQNLTWPGKDYYNPRIAAMSGCDSPFVEPFSRVHPRMPWHDIQTRFVGGAAADVARNFIQRWNHHRPNFGIPLLHIRRSVFGGLYFDDQNWGSCHIQCIRSLSAWSGSETTEKSIMDAYIREIRAAEHFIYIEQQFFISSTAGLSVKNPIANELVKKILHAHRWKRVFRVIVVLPVHPEGNLETENVQALVNWQLYTICKGENSMFSLLKQHMPESLISEYLCFCCLRTFDFFQMKSGMFVPKTEQIYVHSKLMIVDDKTVILGSANINDRSLLGSRDSEIAVVIKDGETLSSTMKGKSYTVSRFAYSLRVYLWRVHLGYFSLGKKFPYQEPRDLPLPTTDVLSEEGYNNLWLEIAEKNTIAFESVFPCMAGSRQKGKKEKDLEFERSILNAFTEGNLPKSFSGADELSTLAKIQGNLCFHPLAHIETKLDVSNFLVKFPAKMVDRSFGLAT